MLERHAELFGVLLLFYYYIVGVIGAVAFSDGGVVVAPND